MRDPLRQMQAHSATKGLTLPKNERLAVVTETNFCTRLAYRGAADLMGEAYGVALPTAPCRYASVDERTALWLGPDEWLLLAPDAERRTLLRALQAALAGKPASIVDLSHRDCGLALNGPMAAQILNSGCPLDLDLAAFPEGMCTRTLLGKAEVVLWRSAPGTFRLEIARSFTPYVVALLGEAMHDLA